MSEKEASASVDEDKSVDGPLDAEQAREQVMREYHVSADSGDEIAKPAFVPPPPLPTAPEPGTANVRVKQGFPTHILIISQFDITLSQDSWTNVPQDQLAEIVQIAAENQVLLETEEA